MYTAYDYAASNSRRMFLLATVFVLFSLAVSWGIGYGIGLAHTASQKENNFLGRLSKTVAAEIINQIFPDSQEVIVEEPLFITDEMKQAAPAFAWRSMALGFIFACLWVLGGYKYGEWLALSAAHAVRLKEEDHLDLYRRVTTICKTAGLPPPKIYLVLDDSLNAFAAGVSKENIALAVTSGLLEKLTGAELEAVLAQQVAHIKLGNTKLWLAGLTTALFLSFLAETCFASAILPKRGIIGSFFLFLVGAGCWVLGAFVAPLMRFAVSRQAAFWADSQGVLINRNVAAFISALEKMQKDSRVELLDLHPSLAGLCVLNPREKSTLIMELSGLNATHPSVESRILALKEMDGRI